MSLSRTMKTVLVFGITMGLLLPALYMIPRGPEVPAPSSPYVPPADQPSRPLANQDAWEAYSGQAGQWQEPLNSSLFTRNVTLGELKVLSGAEAERSLNGSAARPPSPAGGNGTEAAYDSNVADRKSAGAAEREVEEADIVKLQGGYLYVLNPYRGLIIVDLADPDRPVVPGSVAVQGYPQDMYVVGNLSFIILTTTYGYWYNYYTLAAGRGSEVIGGVEVSLGTHIAVVNLKDRAAPKVVMRIPLPGFATDSRRVGDVIYAVTNSYAWTLYGQDSGGSYVTSVDFSEPSTVHRAGALFFNGTSNQVHASPTAFFLAQPQYDYSGERGFSTYTTKVTYIDISDPHGAISARGTFVVAGSLSDKYQMDHYGNTFRIVTHFWGFGGALGSSTLTILNVASPDSITKLGSLDINDAGTLMATRFAGDRAYTIHLPRSVDPLDVLDLSDPKSPELTDVLEMPGWVTHIEVRGTKLIALGVDDSDGKTNVAVSLFDVTDPANAVMKARVRIGTGYTWSAANWEPKALTVVDEQGLVIVPFSSTSADMYWSRTENGIQLVEFDLEKMTLAARGTVANSQPVTRTRAYGDRILATSDYALQVINAQDRARPVVMVTIQFVWNIQDAVPMGDAEVQLYSEGWEGATGLRVVRPGARDWDAPMAKVELDLAQVALFPSGRTLHVLGTNGTEVRLLSYDMSDPASPKSLGTVSQKLPDSLYPGGSGAPRKEGTEEIMPSYIYYTLRTARLDNGVLAVLPDSYYGEQNKTILLFDLSGGQPKALPAVVVALPAQYYGGYAYIGGFLGSGSTLYMTYWGTEAYYLRRVGLEDPSSPVQSADASIRGELVGAAADGSAVYTTAYVYNYVDYTSTYSYSFNRYRLDARGASLDWSAQFVNQSMTGARVSGERAYLTLASGVYYYGYGYADGIRVGAGGDMKGDESSVQLPRTDLIVLDLGASGPRIAGKLGMDGYAYIQEVAGNAVFVYGEGMLAAYRMGEGGLGFAGALALRGYVMHVRAFDGGALVSEGMYGTETLRY